jgi:hypothetical protein
MEHGGSGTMPTRTLQQLKRHLRPGRVYRRQDLLPWSQSVDRHLKELTVDGTLQKLRTGLYYYPRTFEFGKAPADEHELFKAFLKTDRFIVTSPNAYNQLGLGTTQLATNGLSTIRSDMERFHSAIDWLLLSVDLTSQGSFLQNFCWSISSMN